MKTLVFSCVVLSLAVVLAACSSSSSSGSGGSAGSSASAAGTTTATTHIHVGMVVESLSNAFFAAMVQGAKAAAAKYGVTLTTAAPVGAEDDSQQANELSSMVSAGNQCYIFDPLSSVNLVTPLAQASRQGAPLIQLSTPPDPSVDTPRGINVTTFLGTDNSTAGAAAGALMVKVLPAGSDVAIIGGVAGVEGTNDRPNGFRSAVQGKLNVIRFDYVQATDEATALSVAAEMIRGAPSLKGIFTIGGEQALGAQIAVDNAGKAGTIKVVGVDGILPQLQQVQAGKMAGAVQQFPYEMGYQGIEACILAHAGIKVPLNVPTPTLAVTSANAAGAVASYPAPAAGVTIPDPFAVLLTQHGIQ
jgi:ABC-type sugar transport system substrate-binding protein